MERHAFYSAKSAAKFGSSFWKVQSGCIVEVTAVSLNKDTTYNWSDKEYVGIVTECIRKQAPIPSLTN